MFCWYFKYGVSAKTVTNITNSGEIFCNTCHDWPSWANENTCIHCLLVKCGLTRMNINNKKNFFADFTSRSDKYYLVTNIIVIRTSYSDSFSPKTSYSALSKYLGHISFTISRKTTHSSAVRVRYWVLFVNAKSDRSCIVVAVVLCVLLWYRWMRYSESL